MRRLGLFLLESGASRVIPRAAELFEKLPRWLRRHRLMTAWMQLTR